MRDYHADIVTYCRAYYHTHRYLPTASQVGQALNVNSMTAYRHMRAARAMGTLPADSLTQRQAEVLDYYRAYIAEHGYSPTINAVAQALKGDRSYVHECVEVLVQRGLLMRRARHSTRAIVLPDTDERSAA